jgi:hypothetical protein
MSLSDTEAIATWESDEAPEPGGTPQPYRCTACTWTGRGETALRHYRATGHSIRGRDWPAGWSDCQWSVPPDAPSAVYAFDWDLGAGPVAMYTVVGGPRDRSTVTAETLRAMGIRVSER